MFGRMGLWATSDTYAAYLQPLSNLKKLLYFIIYLTISDAFCQNVGPEGCNKFGEPDWTIYEQHFRNRGVIKTGARIREYDENISAVTPSISNYRYVLNKLYFRWDLEDDSIPYIIQINNIMDAELVKVKTSECAIWIYPDSIMQQNDGDLLNLEIERETGGNFNWGLSYILKPMERKERSNILAQLEKCPNLDCQLNELIKRELYIDALSLIEEQPLNNELKSKFWDLANKALADR